MYLKDLISRSVTASKVASVFFSGSKCLSLLMVFPEEGCLLQQLCTPIPSPVEASLQGVPLEGVPLSRRQRRHEASAVNTFSCGRTMNSTKQPCVPFSILPRASALRLYPCYRSEICPTFSDVCWRSQIRIGTFAYVWHELIILQEMHH